MISRAKKQIFKEIQKEPALKFIENFIKKYYPQAKIYLVGGAVRDALLGKKIEDWDFLIANLAIEKIEKFLKRHGQVKLTDTRAFGVFKFFPRLGGKNSKADSLFTEIDITLPRREAYEKGKRKKHVKVKFDPDLPIEEDLARRDFTINAIALEIRSWKLGLGDFIDPFQGIKDIKKKIIRAVGSPEERFQEDPSRILRALRLAVQLNFKIEQKTWKALKKLMPEINKWFIESQVVSGRLSQAKKQRVARETIAEEFLKAFSVDSVKTLDLYEESGALKELIPEVEELKKIEQGIEWHSEGDVYTHTRLALKKLPKKASLDLKVALLFHDLGKKETQIKVTLRQAQGLKEQKVSFHGHDVAGVEICGEIIKRLRLDSLDKKSPYYLNPAKVKWLIRHHMLILNTDPEEIRESTLEKYFFREDKWGDDLLALTLADAKASQPISGKIDLTKYQGILKRIRQLEKKHRLDKKKNLPPPLLNGREIMKALNLPPGPLIGQIKEELRIKQLKGEIKSKKEAFDEIRKIRF
jgi:tRNA nucleotidyltransferase/poly(A) polymerase